MRMGQSLASSRLWIVALVLLTYLAVASAVLLPYADVKGWTYPFLMAASTGFLALGLLTKPWQTTSDRWMFSGLMFCWLGDFFGPSNFALGAGLFLLAHVLFVIAFIMSGLNRRNTLWATLLTLPSLGILAWLLPQVEESMRVLVIAYTLVITVMVITAAGTRRLVFVGAVIFYISDIFVARWRFVDHDPINALICYPLYYTACLILAYSLFQSNATATSEKNPELA